VGGFVYALDCGETMDLPNILQRDAGECTLVADGDSVGVCSKDSVKMYTFKVGGESGSFSLTEGPEKGARAVWLAPRGDCDGGAPSRGTGGRAKELPRGGGGG
jgi:hypothetical protein